MQFTIVRVGIGRWCLAEPFGEGHRAIGRTMSYRRAMGLLAALNAMLE